MTYASTPGYARRPFDALDGEWAAVCRRHRRSRVVAGWARREPALSAATGQADVIPTPRVDRTPYRRALARVTAGGDDLAARALLQIFVPGLVRLASQWPWGVGGMAAAGWDAV